MLASYAIAGITLVVIGINKAWEALLRICFEQEVPLRNGKKKAEIYYIIGALLITSFYLKQLYVFDMYTQLTKSASVTLPNVSDAIEKQNFTTMVTHQLSDVSMVDISIQNQGWVHKILKGSLMAWAKNIVNILSETKTVDICPWQIIMCPPSHLVAANTDKLILLQRFPFVTVILDDLLVMKAILLASRRSYFLPSCEQLFTRWSGLTVRQNWDSIAIAMLLGKLEQGGILEWLSEQFSDSLVRSFLETEKSVGLTTATFMNLVKQLRSRIFSERNNQLFTDTCSSFSHVTVSDIRALWTICIMMWLSSWLCFLTEFACYLGNAWKFI